MINADEGLATYSSAIHVPTEYWGWTDSWPQRYG